MTKHALLLSIFLKKIIALFHSYVSEGMHTNLGAQRDQFYRAAVQSGVESEIASTTTAPLVQAADAQNKSDESGQEAPDQASEGGGNSA